MEKEKLTLEDCFKYPNAMVQFETDEVRTGFIRKIDFKADRQLVIECIPVSFYHSDVSDCKLQLRSIADLTEEESINVDRLDSENMGLELRIPYHSDLTFFNYNEGDKLIFDYLRSINIDIDGFLECGKAVKG